MAESTTIDLNPLDVEHERKRARSLLKSPEGRQALRDVTGYNFVLANEVEKKPIVAILTPSMDGFEPRTSGAFERMLQASKQSCVMYPEPAVSTSILHWSRNDLIIRLYKSEKPFDYVLLMDDDMEPEPEALIRLLAHKKDIVAAGCTLRTDPPKPNYRRYEPETFSFRQETGCWDKDGKFVRGLMPTGGIGTAFMLISRKALEQIADYYLTAQHEKRFLFSPFTIDEKGYFHYEPYDETKLLDWQRKHIAAIEERRWTQLREDGNGWWFENLKAPNWIGEYSEDISFCFKAQQLGLEIWVDTSVKVGHLGTYAYSLDDWEPFAQGLLKQETHRQMYCAAIGKPFQMPKVEQPFVETGKISVLIPSRGRGKLLNQTIEALLAKAKGDVEILVRLDNDEPPNAPEMKWGMLSSDPVQIILGPRHAYRNLHLYYQELAEKATGDWLMTWSDDVLMETEGWDEKIRACGGGLKVLNPSCRDSPTPQLNLFPIVSRPLFELLGHLSLQCHGDSWLQVVARMNGIEQRVDVTVKHLREEIDDATKKTSLETYRESSPEFFSAEFQEKLLLDVEKVKAALTQSCPNAT